MSIETQLSHLFLHEKPVKILLALKMNNDKSYASTLAKAADCTYSHTVKILDVLHKSGLVTFRKKGRVKYIELTEIGIDIANDFQNATKKFSKIDKESGKK